MESFGEDMSCPVCHALLVPYTHHTHITHTHTHKHTVLLTRTNTQMCFHVLGACAAHTHTHIQNIFMHTNLHVCVCIYVSLFVRSHGRQGTMFWIHSNRITLSVSELN